MTSGHRSGYGGHISGGARQQARKASLAGLAAAACAAAALAAATGSVAAPGDELLPDLRTQPHAELYVEGGELRLSNTIANRGVGPAEIYAEPTAGGDCDGDGDSANDRIAFQRVFQDSANPASPGFFVRGQDTVSNSDPVGCMIYHPTHSHWHLEDFSTYLLRRESTGLLASRSTKVSFCVIDTDHAFPALPGSPAGDYYGDAGCGPTSVEGLSIGWADTYGAYLDGQSLNIAGLPAATYCLISRADPADRLDEITETNNGRRTRIQLDPAAHTVQQLAGPCQLP